ncbi:MAG: hypothetical protein ACREFI_14920 [Stellaceae bacterium]
MNYRQILIVSRLGLAPHNTLADEQLRALIGPYATNVIYSLVDRGLISSIELEEHRDGWRLTLNGRDTAAELFGPAWSPIQYLVGRGEIS